MDLSRRETSLLTGVGVLLAIVAVAFFSLTMAFQQMAQRKARWDAVQEQVAQARRQAQRQPTPADRDRLVAEAAEAARWFVTPEAFGQMRAQLEALGTEAGTAVVSMRSLTPDLPAQELAALAGFEGCYQVIPFVGTIEGRYRAIAAFLDRATVATPALAVRSLTLSPAPQGLPSVAGQASEGGGMRLRARLVLEAFVWVPGALPKGIRPAGQTAGERGPVARQTEPAWGRDPFNPRYVETPGGVDGVTLNGIIWDPQNPTCVLNGMVLGIGGIINGYTVTAMTQEAVLLRGPKEAVLTVSP